MTVQSFAALAARTLNVQPPTAGRFVWYVGELRTGRILTELPLIGTQWSVPMDGPGPLTGTVYLGGLSRIQSLALWDATRTARSFLALGYTAPDGAEELIEAGPIWTRRYTSSDDKLSLGASGLWSYYDHRFVMPVLAGAYPSTVTTEYDSISLGTIAKRLVELAATHTGGDLPIILPDDETAADDADHQRTYPGYELDRLGDSLRNLTTVENGPEIRFRPRRSDTPGYIEWVLEVGTEADPELHQVGPDHFWDYGLPKGNVIGVDVTEDGSGLGGRAWTRGSGQDVGTLIGVADDTTLTDAGYPLLELDVPNHDTVEQQSTLDQASAGAVAGASRPRVTLTATVARDLLPRFGSYRVGDYATVTLAGHRLVADGTYRSRVTQVLGGDSDQIQVDLAPIDGSL